MSMDYANQNIKCETQCRHFKIIEKYIGFKRFICLIAPVPINEIGREDYLVGKYVHCTCLGRKFEPKDDINEEASKKSEIHSS